MSAREVIVKMCVMQDWHTEWRRRKDRKHRFFSRNFWKNFSKAKLMRMVAIGALAATVGGVFLMMLLFAWFAKDLPDPNRVVRREGFSTKIMDRNGNSIYDLFQDENRVPVSLADVPIYLQQGTIAVEDSKFYAHEGFDIFGIVRGFSRLFTRGRAQGGSTLTQQLVKNVLLTSERTLPRKFKELILAIQIERKFSKDEILQMYLNEAPYGGTAWGIAAAAERYFGKLPKELTLTEAAFLAGMPQSPSRYSPYGSDPKAYVARTLTVLRRMKEDGYITQEQEQQAASEVEKLQFRAQGSTEMKAPHFVFYVKERLAELLGEGAVEQGGLRVTTTLDLELQDMAQQTVAEEIAKVESLHITNGASLVMDPNNGEVLAMVGSKDYFAENYDGKVNVVMSQRQPGSSIKPVTYATAFEKGYTPGTMLMDVPTKFPGGNNDYYEPQNYDGKFRGPVQLRFALGSSLNVPAVKLLSLIGLKDMLQTAYDMGFDTLEPTTANMKRFGLAVTLGGGEVRLFDLVRSYSAFANGGEKIEPVSILKVELDGKTIFENKPKKAKRVLSPETAFLINHVLHDNNARLLTFGANSYLNMGGRSIAVKTGTTNDMRDNWTIGWSTKAVVGVWVGNNDNSAMKAVASGVSGASPIWRRIMMKAWEKYGGDEFKPTSKVESRLVDTISGYPEHDGYPARAEYVIKGTLPTEPDPIHTRLKICRSGGKLATDVDIARGEYDEKEYFVFKAESGDKLWQEGIDGWLVTQPDERYKAPTEYCDSANDVIVSFEQPRDKERIDSQDVKVRIRVTTEGDLEFVKLYVDGKEVESFGSRTVETTLKLSDGTHVLKSVARNKSGKEGASEVKIGVNKPWDYVPASPTPSPTPTPTPTPSPSPSGALPL